MSQLDRTRRLLGLTLVLGAALAPLAGCGGGSSTQEARSKPSASTAAATTVAPSTNTTATQPTTAAPKPAAEAAFIARADAICRHLDTVLLPDRPKGTGLKELALLAPRAAVVESAAVAEIARLKPPPSLAHDWQRIVAYRSTLATELAKLGHAAKSVDIKAIAAAAGVKKRVRVRLHRTATHAGFGFCGEIR
jgi:hypothetical protein